MVERCVAMAASLAASALDQGLSVGLCVWNGKWNTIRPTRGKRHKSDLLSLLAQLPLNDSQPAGEIDCLGRATLAGRRGDRGWSLLRIELQGTVAEFFASGHLLTIAADSSRAQAWFKFDDKTDFPMSAMPPDQATGQAYGLRGDRRPPMMTYDARHFRLTAYLLMLISVIRVCDRSRVISRIGGPGFIGVLSNALAAGPFRAI